jgi:hypothetical protein
MTTWYIEVRNVPPTVRQPLPAAGELKWRIAIQEAVRMRYPDAPLSPEPGGKYAMHIVFRMTQAELLRPAVDLDNLAKPILDTVFTSDNVRPGMPSGVLFRLNDTWVFQLRAEKVQVDSPEERGADITVTVDGSA